jgi:hypothetical protein
MKYIYAYLPAINAYIHTYSGIVIMYNENTVTQCADRWLHCSVALILAVDGYANTNPSFVIFINYAYLEALLHTCVSYFFQYYYWRLRYYNWIVYAVRNEQIQLL